MDTHDDKIYFARIVSRNKNLYAAIIKHKTRHSKKPTLKYVLTQLFYDVLSQQVRGLDLICTYLCQWTTLYSNSQFTAFYMTQLDSQVESRRVV